MGAQSVFPDNIHSPVLLIDSSRVHQNIQTMANRAKKAGVRFRPHFKTHQSAAMGEWFRKAGVNGITVSSVAMARYFAEAGWKDITLAFPFNIREIPELNRLDEIAEIHLLADHPDTITALSAGLTNPHRVFVKIDTGYHRCGIPDKRVTDTIALIRKIESAEQLSFGGILTHGGHSYHCDGPDSVQRTFREIMVKMDNVRSALRKEGISDFIVSVGNTPGCSVADNFEGVDEIRPGNFIFYDLMQLSLGVCREENLALALLCPVIGIYPDRNEIAVLGGAVHFSKEQIVASDSRPVYGYGIAVTSTGFGSMNREISLIDLSQEHGIVQAPAEIIGETRIGDVLAFVPVHSCLTADLYNGYISCTGERIPRLNSVSARSVQLFPSPENSRSVSF